MTEYKEICSEIDFKCFFLKEEKKLFHSNYTPKLICLVLLIPVGSGLSAKHK